SRSLKLGWRAYSADQSYSETNTVQLLVKPKVTVRPARRRVHRGGRVRLVGHVLGGPYPSDGVLVTLQGRVGHTKWRTFALTRTKPGGGTFRRSYKLRPATRGTVQFRAKVVQQAGFPYLAGTSSVATAKVP